MSLLRDRDLERKQRAGKSIQAVFQQMDNDPPWDCGSVLFLYFKGCNGAYPGTLAVLHGSAFKSVHAWPWTLTPAPLS